MKRRTYLCSLFVLIVIISGCVQVKQPTVTGSATIKHVNIDYDLEILLTNPNNFDFKVSDISVIMQRANGESIGEGIVFGGDISASSSKRLSGNLELNDAFLKAQNDEKIYLVVDATASGGYWFYTKEEQIHKKVEIENPLKGKTTLQINIS